MAGWLKRIWRWWTEPSDLPTFPAATSTGAPPSDLEMPEPGIVPDVPAPFAENHNEFAISLYQYLCGDCGNLAFSPLGAWSVLGMAYLGAVGETADQMQKVLRFPFFDDTAESSVQIIQRLEATGQRGYRITIANSLWCEDSSPIRASFRERVERHIGGQTYAVDFRHNREDACLTINQWVGETTRQCMRELVSPDDLDERTHLVLASAVYFEGRWAYPFENCRTQLKPFHLEAGGMVQVPLMHQAEDVRYVRASGYQAVDLDYLGGAFSMLVLLPDEMASLHDFEAGLSVSMLEECVASLTVQPVDLYLPKFTVEWSGQLRRALATMGMPLAFSPHADFSGINGAGPYCADALFISNAVQRAIVEVTESGTRAAAVTRLDIASLGVVSRPLAVFRADRPFLFAIRNLNSGTILFLGRVANPTQDTAEIRPTSAGKAASAIPR